MKNYFLARNITYLIILILTIIFSSFIIEKSNFLNLNFNKIKEVLYLFFPLEHSKEFLYSTIKNTFIMNVLFEN